MTGTKESRAIIRGDGIYASKCEPRVTLYPRHHQSLTLADYERAFNVFMRDTAILRASMDVKLAELRDQEQRGRALLCVAPLPHSTR